VSDWLKPGAMPPDATLELDDDAMSDDTEVPEPSTARPAGGGYGSTSGRASSGGSGEATDETSNPGTDAQSEWLRDAGGGPR
jgi:hypothetical protein